MRDDASTGQCISRCTTDTDCPAGEHCRARRGQSVCVPEPPCKDEDDCREDEVCRNSSCERPPCQTNADCPGDLACDLAYGDCVGGECSEDVLAPNHSAEDAAEIGFETLTELRLCPGRDDWYALQLDSAESVDIRVEHPADRDLDAAVFGTEGRVIASNSQPPPESARADTAFRVRFTSTRRQTVRIRIFDGGLDRSRAERPSTGDAYELRVSHPPNIDCSDDGSEENDHPATASELPVQVGAPTRLEFQLCPGDIDWYRLPDVAAERGVWVKLLDAPNHLYVELRSHAGHVASGKPGDELRFRRTGQRGPWLIGVRSERARAASYALEYAVTPPYDCPAPGRHAQPGDATDLAPGRRASFALCPLDSDWEIDWLSLESPENVSALNLELEADGGFPDADVTLYERVTYDDGQKVGYDLLRSAAKLERTYRLSKLVDPSQTLLVRIGSDQPIDAFRRPPAYSVEYSYTD